MIIDPEFKALIPPLSAEEYRQLEENILRDGCRDPLVVWKHKVDGGAWGETLLDGHNRYGICQRHSMEFSVEEIHFADRIAAMDWMDANQLGRRNLSPEQMSLLRGRIYNRSKKARGAPEGNSNRVIQRDQIDPIETRSTAETLAEKHGVSAPTIKRDGKFAESVDALKEYAPDINERVMSGEVSRRDVLEAAAEPERAAEILSHNHRAQGTGENEWYTPQEFIEAARAVMGAIDLDPASSMIAQERVKSGRYFTLDDDGLAQDWAGRVWLNPPYAQPAIQQFMEKAVSEFQSGRVSQSIILTHNYTDTRWFHIGVSAASAICFTRGRIGFLSPEGKKAAPTQGQAFFYFGSDVSAFKREFAKYGFIVEIACAQELEAAA